ncbi:hypothetical protein BQ8482_380311 [Mesorhizobium delmotii]|uniref:Uncharacterized protein n=1 Tax=Mesorhizobium delmotii TaxID=1631247 RepID=A0A2P9ASH9_9HYPH|nr:hypothetical protein BQ8482_380311 [Mesorhizobium delmotii]
MPTRSGCRADHLSEDAVEASVTIQNAWAGLKLVRMAIEQTCPAVRTAERRSCPAALWSRADP